MPNDPSPGGGRADAPHDAPRASPRYPGVGPHFAGRCPGWPDPRATDALPCWTPGARGARLESHDDAREVEEYVLKAVQLANSIAGWRPWLANGQCRRPLSPSPYNAAVPKGPAF